MGQDSPRMTGYDDSRRATGSFVSGFCEHRPAGDRRGGFLLNLLKLRPADTPVATAHQTGKMPGPARYLNGTRAVNNSMQTLASASKPWSPWRVHCVK